MNPGVITPMDTGRFKYLAYGIGALFLLYAFRRAR